MVWFPLNVPRDRNSSNLRFVVVGGDSADSIRKVVRALPEHAGFAVVIAARDGVAASTLESDSRLPVVDVKERTRVATDSIFVIAKERVATLDGSDLVTAPADGAGTGQLDRLLRSIADAVGADATAVILGGKGTDGALGLKRLKETGGLTIAEQPNGDAAEMPRAAIATGFVDLVLPAGEIGAHLVALMKQEGGSPEVDERRTETAADTLRDILTLVRIRSSNDFSAYKRATLYRRISRRMQVCECDTIAKYHQYLRNHPAELSHLIRDFLISVTNFFRDPDVFDALAADVVPKLFANKGPNDHVRVWVAGCATGEEAYSFGILLLEHAAKLSGAPQVQIFATDIDETALGEARLGQYPESISGDVSKSRLQMFFTRENAGYRVSKELREVVLFSPHNVLRDPPFSRLDLISCRNLLIYLNRDAQNRVLTMFHFGLRTDGYLVLGTSESAENSAMFYPIDPKLRVFMRRAVPASLGDSFVAGQRWSPPVASQPQPQLDRPPTMGEIHYRLVEQYAPPSVLVNGDLDIVHLSEHAGEFLKFDGGEPTRQLLRLAHPALRLDLRTALYAARQQRGLDSRVVRFDDNGTQRAVELRVRAVDIAELGPGAAIVMFDELQPGEARVEESAGVAMEPVVREIEDELHRTRDQLRTTIEQYETSLEELKASNEELQAINEELRSASEELETSKEELQSVNEELTTLNQELKIKIDEISNANSDLQNLMSSTDIGVVFLDRNLNIKRFTPRVQDLFNVIPSDIGRPLAHLTHRLESNDLPEIAQGVLQSLQSVERELKSRDGKRYLARWLPYRSLEDRIDGIVLTFVDVTDQRAALDARRRTEEALQQAQGRLRAVLRASAVTAVQFDDHLHVVWGHVDGRELSAAERETLGFLGDRQARQLRALAQQALTDRAAQREDFEIGADGTTRKFDVRLEPSTSGVLAIGIPH